MTDTTFTRTAVRNLLPGDQINNGVIKYGPYRNSKTPKGKLTVEYVNLDGKLVAAHWNPATLVPHIRPSRQAPVETAGVTA